MCLAVVRSGMKKILKGFHSGGDKSSKSDDAPPRTGGITFGGAEIVDDGYDEPRQIDISEGTKSNGEQGSSSPGTQKKSPGRVTISLPDEEKSKKVKRAPTKGAPGSVSLMNVCCLIVRVACPVL